MFAQLQRPIIDIVQYLQPLQLDVHVHMNTLVQGTSASLFASLQRPATHSVYSLELGPWPSLCHLCNMTLTPVSPKYKTRRLHCSRRCKCLLHATYGPVSLRSSLVFTTEQPKHKRRRLHCTSRCRGQKRLQRPVTCNIHSPVVSLTSAASCSRSR